MSAPAEAVDQDPALTVPSGVPRSRNPRRRKSVVEDKKDEPLPQRQPAAAGGGGENKGAAAAPLVVDARKTEMCLAVEKFHRMMATLLGVPGTVLGGLPDLTLTPAEFDKDWEKRGGLFNDTLYTDVASAYAWVTEVRKAHGRKPLPMSEIVLKHYVQFATLCQVKHLQMYRLQAREGTWPNNRVLQQEATTEKSLCSYFTKV